MKNLLLSIFVFFTSFVFSQSCTHQIYLTDTYGDGWNGGSVSVSVNGLTVLSNITLNSGLGPAIFNFTASSGQTIRVWRTLSGSWPSEMRVQIRNNTGTILLNTIQPVTGGSTFGGQTCIASCSGGGGGGCVNSSAFGSLTTPSVPGPQTISTCTFQSEYNTIFSVVSGRQYRSTYNLGGYITVRHTSFNGTVVAAGFSPLTWTAPISGTYYIHYNTNSSCGTASSCGTSTIECLSCSAPAAPSNDLVCNATPIVCGQSIAGTTVNSTTTGTGEMGGFCGVSQTTGGVWYVVAGNGQNMTANLCATAWDSKISVFSGPNCSSLTCIGGNDDWGPVCSSSSASYGWYGAPGVNYYILVHGFSTTSPFSIALTCVTPPPPNPTSITQSANPICAGNSTTLTANGAVGTVYWYINGCGVTQIGTGNSITVSPNTTTTYNARNFSGGLFSNGCVSTAVTVNPTPNVSVTPVSNTICSGTNTQLVSSVTGLPAGSTPTYTWTPSTGLTNPSAPSPFASPTTTQSYQVSVSFNGCSNSTSTTINVNPSVGFVSTVSGNNTIIAGTQESYSITPVPNATYQWAYTQSITAPFWTNIPNSNTPSISFYWPQTTTDGSVRVTVSNSTNCGTQVRFFNIITNGALPVELLSFDGSCNNNIISLEWKTATEHNSDYFEVVKSRDGENWSSLTTLGSAGNSTQELTYNTKDGNAIDGNNYYKLIQYDIDGEFKEYGPINVICNGNTKGYFSIFPNPSTGDFQVILNNKQLIGEGTLMIKDTKGSEILTKEIKISSGINLFNVSNLNLPSGIYYISITSNDVSTEIIKQMIR
jgi:hypothetical protein